MDRILASLQAALPDYAGQLPPDHVTLQQLEGWDSMVSVSFLLELESAFNTKLRGVVLKGDMTIGQIKDVLRAKGVAI